MNNIFNFNVPIENPSDKKSPKEIELFLKWQPILKMKIISEEQITEYKKDLLTLKIKTSKAIAVLVLLITSFSFAQSSIVAAGGETENISYTIGPGLNELQIAVIEETTLAVPSFEMPVEPKPIIKKKPLTFFEKLIQSIKKLFK